jgi:hypothetical protein
MKVPSCLLMSSHRVRSALALSIIFIIVLPVPLASLVSATRPPSNKHSAIVTEEGCKRYFVVHGGLFSKDDVTLDDIRKVDRFGRQPGQEGLMCEVN